MSDASLRETPDARLDVARAPDNVEQLGQPEPVTDDTGRCTPCVDDGLP